MNENTNDNVKTLRCEPLDPNERRCTSVPGPVAPKAASTESTPLADTPAKKSGEGGTGIPTSDGVEVWSRNNGETMRVKRVEHGSSVIYLPLTTAPQPQPVDPQSPLLKTVKQGSAVGRSQMSRCGSGSKGSCKLTGMRSSSSAKTNDQNRGDT